MSSPEDRAFGEAAQARGYITQAQLDECYSAMALITQAGLTRSFAEILVEKGFLTDVQAETLRRSIESPEVRVIAGFELISKLGEGGMGAVFKARQLSMDRLVALKLLPERLAKNREFTARFLREARVAAKLDHVNIVRGLDVGRDGEDYYFAMEYVEGESIAGALKREGSLSEERTLHIAIQIARALDHAMEQKLIHRDIKPDNILLASEGNIAKLADLGLARSTASESTVMTQTGVAMGTPHYMSPEQARGEKSIDIRTDIYSLGATLYHMLAGETPFAGDSVAVILTKHLTEVPLAVHERKPGISANVSAVIARMMAKEPEQRYQTPKDLIKDLELVADSKAPINAGSPETLGAPASAAGDAAGLRTKSLIGARDLQETSATLLSQPRPSWVLPVTILGGITIIGLIVLVGLLAVPGRDPAPAPAPVAAPAPVPSEKPAAPAVDEKQIAEALRAAEAAQKNDDLEAAVEKLGEALKLREDAAVRQRLKLLEALRNVEGLVSQAAMLRDAGELENAREKYVQARDLAKGEKREEIVAALDELEARLKMERAIAEIDGAVAAQEWRRAWDLASRAAGDGITDERVKRASTLAVTKLTPPRELVGPLGIAFVLVRGGTFKMGDADGRKNEQPAHDVTLPAIYVARCEVTVSQFEAYRQGRRTPLGAADRAGRLPVTKVTWRDAVDFCKHLNSIAPQGGATYRLPTEAEWEFVARGTGGRRYPWGAGEPTPERANLSGDGDGYSGPAPVGSFANGATPDGVLDMAGNVFEWCADRYGAYGADPVTEPSGPAAGQMRVIRGGAYAFDGALARTAARGGRRPEQGAEFIGFRVVRELTPDEVKFLRLSSK